jgi:uncharacterized protein with FMN-binding domain
MRKRNNLNSTYLLLLLLTLWMLPSITVAQDSLEFLDGSIVQGKILEIRKDAKEFDFRLPTDDPTSSKTYPYSDVLAVTFNGKRFVLTPPSNTMRPNGKVSGGKARDASSSLGSSNRSPKEVLALIESAGKKQPDWFESTVMNHPESLDLSWPMDAKGPWDESKNVGQYLWGRIKPNEGRWHSGIKLVHQCMALHENDTQKLSRDMDTLGEMYFTLLQDYPRAAFWLQKAKAPVSRQTGIHLAECYWRLGNQAMAMELMRGKSLHPSAIKLLGDMGEIDQALRVTSYYAKTPQSDDAFLNAGDALRSAGRLDDAIEYYQRVIDSSNARNEEYRQRNLARAAGAIEAIKLYDRADLTRVKDGTYTDSSTGYNGKLEVQIKVSGGKIETARVTKHQEKQFYAAITDTTAQIINKQSIQDIDGTSGATITSQAIIHASARALAQGAQ